MIHIEVRRRSDDYHAQLAGLPTHWGCGRSVDEAVGSAIRNHAEQCQVAITFTATGETVGYRPPVTLEQIAAQQENVAVHRLLSILNLPADL